MYLVVYAVLGICQSLAIMVILHFVHIFFVFLPFVQIFFRKFCFFSQVATILFSVYTLDAARKLHNTMLLRIMRGPMAFFETTPLGRILNRLLDWINC